MQAAKKPENEEARLQSLHEYQIMDTAPEVAFDDITKLAAYICGTPYALITLLDEDRQWFKSSVGVDAETKQSARDIAFCGHVVYDNQALLVPDALKDERFHDNPFVTGDMAVRFYAGQPLIDDSGNTMGSLCVLDRTPREMEPAQMDALAALSRQVVAQMKLRRELLAEHELAEALNESQKLLKQYFSRDDVFMGIVEFDGKVITQLYNNPVVMAYFDQLGLPADQFFEDTALPGIDLWFGAYRRCAESRQAQHFDMNQPYTDLIMRATVHYVGESRRGIARLAFTVEDVTAQRAAERVIEEQRQMVVQSSKLSALGEMAAGMAHEINNPLAIIGGRAQEMRMLIDRGKFAPEPLLNAVGSIEKTVARISKIIRGLRSFARESSHDPLEMTQLSGVLQDTLSFCTARFRGFAVRLDVDDQAPRASVRARPAELSQVLLNLLNNAFDAVRMQNGDRWTRVELREREDAFEVAVVDSGPGVPVDIREKIMQPFFTTKPVNQGTGLGLSISKGIVEGHGGRLSLDQSSARTRFVISLPKAKAP